MCVPSSSQHIELATWMRTGRQDPHHTLLSTKLFTKRFSPSPCVSSLVKSSPKCLCGASGAFLLDDLNEKKLGNSCVTDLHSVLHFARVVFDDESRLHDCRKFNVGVAFVLTLKLVQQCLVCGLRETEWKEWKRKEL